MGRILRCSLAPLAVLAVSCAAPGAGAGPPRRVVELEVQVDLARGGADTVLWLPMPREDGVQHCEVIEAPPAARLSGPDRHGNRYFSITGAAAGSYLWRFRVERRPDGAGLSGGEADPVYLQANRLVPVDGEAATRAAEAAVGRTGVVEQARAFYDRVLADMVYRKEGEGWGTGSTEWACRAGYGNCTDFHALFISMARSRGIPARFTIGFPLPAEAGAGEIGGYHCWAHYFRPGVGWVPVDISEADKHPERREEFFGTLPADRVAMTVGRDLILDPPQQAGPLNFLVRAYAEKDGRPLEAATTVRFRDLR
ncbi:MAG: transglutaminase domain-containing protein [Planctomycetota bacterium]|nr:MAG: transglutaminase domain-containing protein [Planctomycetota bacterium]